ncbi:uncharacterized protein LOC107270945 isoform X2 [Cephus cinctus]|uniref:Uncharacterized protein LOC107270945 isoform X2 n=1 Tax=Cephus cinctus TaxID=211228 RepID=A0AAJ7FPH4_CEPCN|nr:uncharacterized protein LOC107270945 isoform X2 [Cephus cinctus]
MRISCKLYFIIFLALLTYVAAQENLDDIDFDDNDKGKIATSLKLDDGSIRNKTEKIQKTITNALKWPEKREQIGEVVPIMRSMSPPQKLVMGTLISSRISKNETASPAPLEEIQSMFSEESRENATRDLMLPISVDIAKILTEDTPEELPEAQELRYRRPGSRRRPYYRPPPPRRPSSLNRRNVHPGSRPSATNLRPSSSRRPTDTKRGPTDKECTFFTNTVCLEAMDYPHDAITRSIRSNRDMVAALLTDYKVQDSGGFETDLPEALPLRTRYDNNRFESNEIKRRADHSPFDNVEEGFTCPSQVRYARPQLARAASGVWKYIINTGEHTQTLRLEKCSNPHRSCSFISENYRSSCVQVYNYHRLLTWDTTLGLHMDIFKVPTCCSCHVHGYSELFPPHQKDPPPKSKESFPGAEFATEDQNDEFVDFGKTSNFIKKHNKPSSYDTNSGILNDGPSSYLNDLTDLPTYQDNKKPLFDLSVTSRPSFGIPGRVRPKKQPSLPSRPFDKLPQQHAPNTRAPGYMGPLLKVNRPRPSGPFRRESGSHLDYSAGRNTTSDNSFDRFSEQFDEEINAPTILHSGAADDEYHEPHRRINYNYHPIIDFFKPEASMLQSPQPQLVTQPAAMQSNSNSWKPMVSS